MKKINKADQLPTDEEMFLHSLQDLVILDEPERSGRIEELILNSSNEIYRQRYEKVLNRITMLGVHVEGFLPEEVTDFQNEVVRKLYHRLDNDYLDEYLRLQVRNLIDICDNLKRDLDANRDNILWYAKQGYNYQGIYIHNKRIMEWLEIVIKRLKPSKVTAIVSASSKSYTKREIAIVCDMLDIELTDAKGLELLRVYADWIPNKKSGTKSLYSYKIDRTFYSLTNKKTDEPKLTAITNALELLRMERGLLDSRNRALAYKTLSQYHEDFLTNYQVHYGKVTPK